jgi:DNA helicase-2/ATP-dependent DNA helicase PcrA
VVRAANTLLEGTPSQGVELRAQQPGGPEVTYDAQPDEVAEAESVAAQVLRLRDGGRALGEVAVLFRINAQSEAFEEALSARGIPYVVRGAQRFFDRPEVREAVTRIRGAARSGEGQDVLETVRGTLAGMGWTPEAPTARGQTRDRWESWQALMDQALEFSAAGGTLAEFVDDLDRRAAEQHAPVADGVTLATFHAAKGLEWDSVFLCGLQDGTLPITYAETAAELEEERRLLYVGMTRARRDLALSWAMARNPGGRASRQPSRFLTPLLPQETLPLPTSRKAKGARMCLECGRPLQTSADKARRRCADCPAPYDEELYERLRQWRTERAREEEIAAFMVFSNATLEEIATRRPRSTRELLAVSGVGKEKLHKYGEELLELVG